MSSSAEHVAPRDAASVILVRDDDASAAAQVLLLRRHRGASFMSSAFVFPGGAAEPDEPDPRVTAARELFEEAGVLLADRPLDGATLAAWRSAVAAETTTLAALLDEAGAALDLDAMHAFAHWITPSIERKRFSARFYVARIPAGQTPSFDNRETVDEVWVTAEQGLARARELRLPPPQVRMLWELGDGGVRGADSVIALAAARSPHIHPILPRMAPLERGFALLLPWDREYETRGTGDSHAMALDHPFAVGPSRFIFEDETWKNVDGPGSPPAG